MYLGIDTSNYTTSLAKFDGKEISQVKKLLTVKQGERGLRQSDALFQHTVNLPTLFDNLTFNEPPKAVGVSTRPRNVDGSYMPCFLAGISCAKAVSTCSSIPFYETSHQVGHILAALFSAKKLDLINEKFIAFHVSGGTTEALLVKPDKDEIIKAEIIAKSNDLKAGQAIDRTGVLLGMTFPCGKELDALSLKSDKAFKVKPSMNGCDCSLSGVENKVIKMISKSEKSEDIARFVLSSISQSLIEMTKRIFEKYDRLPIIYAGGVMSNTLIKKDITDSFGAYFAEPEFSCDNAAGTAIFAYLKDNNL